MCASICPFCVASDCYPPERLTWGWKEPCRKTDQGKAITFDPGIPVGCEDCPHLTVQVYVQTCMYVRKLHCISFAHSPCLLLRRVLIPLCGLPHLCVNPRTC